MSMHRVMTKQPPQRELRFSGHVGRPDLDVVIPHAILGLTAHRNRRSVCAVAAKSASGRGNPTLSKAHQRRSQQALFLCSLRRVFWRACRAALVLAGFLRDRFSTPARSATLSMWKCSGVAVPNSSRRNLHHEPCVAIASIHPPVRRTRLHG